MKTIYMNLVITGNPGVGKHTITEYIQKKNPEYQVLDINKFAIDEKLVQKEQESFEVDVGLLKTRITDKISNNSLIVGHLAPYVLNKSDIDLVIVLRKNPYDLIDIYASRNYSEQKSKENTGSEILGIIVNDSISAFGKEKIFQVDTTSKTPEQIIDRIHEIIEGKNNGDLIDWLSLVKEKNDFNKFFDY